MSTIHQTEDAPRLTVEEYRGIRELLRSALNRKHGYGKERPVEEVIDRLFDQGLIDVPNALSIIEAKRLAAEARAAKKAAEREDDEQ